jgi:hypothetical protein
MPIDFEPASSRTTSSTSAASWRRTLQPARSRMTTSGRAVTSPRELRAAPSPGIYGIALPEALGDLGAGTLG